MTCVFWPEDLTQPGTIVGWRVGSVVIVAGTIYASDVRLVNFGRFSLTH